MRIDKNHWLITKPIAHRGLWGEKVVENSATAYQLACEQGYPIEIDVYLTKDNQLISIHDINLKRLTGADEFVYEKTLDEIKQLRLLGSDEQIPTFDEVLRICEGKSPLLIEIKNQPNKQVVDLLVKRLKCYKGEFAVQSFNPIFMKRVKKLAPEFIRGVLTTAEKTHIKGKVKRWVVKHMPFNGSIKPDFIACFYESLPLRKSKIKNKVVLTWTIVNKEIEQTALKHADNIIFEHYIP